MKYRILGKTGLKVSRLGFGAMRLPMTGEGPDSRIDRDLAVPMIVRAIEAGVDYIDTAVGYCNEDSQRVVGEAIHGRRDGLVIATKNPYYGEDEKVWWANLENSLGRLGTDRIDLYKHHALTWKTYVDAVEPRVSKWMQRAKDQGLVRHVCCSFHDNNEALMKLADTGYVDVITLQYNLLDRQLEEGIAHAHDLGIGVVVMGPVGGGRLGEQSGVLSGIVPGIGKVPELALRFVLANPNVSVALSGMSTMEQVEQNLAVASDSRGLTGEEEAAIAEHLTRLRKLVDLYCTACGYCMPCPSGVNIPEVFGRYNLGRVYDLWSSARERYGWLGNTPWDPGKPADACIECGECEPKCPQKIPIREQLKAAHEELTKK
jgi:hypothetical protein